MTDPGRQARFAVELGRALTGRELPLTSPSPDDVAAALEELGLGPAALADVRTRQQEAGEPWPFPVEREAVADIGFAVFHARLQAVRELLGLTGLVPTRPARRPLNVDERRLVADRPPHWG